MPNRSRSSGPTKLPFVSFLTLAFLIVTAGASAAKVPRHVFAEKFGYDL